MAQGAKCSSCHFNLVFPVPSKEREIWGWGWGEAFHGSGLQFARAFNFFCMHDSTWFLDPQLVLYFKSSDIFLEFFNGVVFDY